MKPGEKGGLGDQALQGLNQLRYLEVGLCHCQHGVDHHHGDHHHHHDLGHHEGRSGGGMIFKLM